VREANCCEDHRAIHKAKVGTAPGVTLKPAERQRHVGPTLEAPEAQVSGLINRAELFALGTDADVRYLASGRELILSPQMIMQALPLDSLTKLPTLNDRIPARQVEWELR
jgi:hypothetical protein